MLMLMLMLVVSHLLVGVNEPLLRDEIYCQLIKQTTNNPAGESIVLGFKLMYLCMATFPPSKELARYILR